MTDTVGSTVTDRFFSSDWQLLETKVGSNTVTRNVWSPVYVDGLVLRDRDTDANSTLDERLYSLQDANWNTTALVNTSGTIQERYTYTPFGQVTFRDSSGSTLSNSAKDWIFLHQGGEKIAAGDYEFRNRLYSPSLGYVGRGGDNPVNALAKGSVIDGFELLEKLHVGGMAHIWKVHEVNHQGDSRLPLIMKVPRIKGGEDPATIVGFEVEMMILPMLRGRHVPQFIAKGDFTRQPYIVMERIEGHSMRPRLDDAPLAIDEVIEIGSRVATAVHDLHRQNLVHLDIKPSNIMFREDGTAVLVDFGLSRHDHLPDLLDEEFTLPMGTGPYMSPEQVQFVRNDPRSDLFALGVMLYHLATGERPFGSPTTVRGLRRRLWLPPMPPRPWWRMAWAAMPVRQRWKRRPVRPAIPKSLTAMPPTTRKGRMTSRNPCAPPSGRCASACGCAGWPRCCPARPAASMA